MAKDSAGIQNGHSVKCEKQRQEVDEQQAILPFMDKDQVPTRSCDVNKLTGVMLVTRVDNYCLMHITSDGMKEITQVLTL